jgi:polyvinyl alcohol dehydrogenase (cytochrome)
VHWFPGLRRPPTRKGVVKLAVVVAILGAVLPVLALAAQSGSWPSGGQNISNSHANAAETKINANNVGGLAVKWTYTTHGDVSAIPPSLTVRRTFRTGVGI